MSTPNLVTVFGGSGFLGRAITQELAKAGAKVRVAVRDPEAALSLKPMGEVGQITPIQANIRNPASVAAAVEGADAVVNLVGVLFQAGGQSFDAVHAAGAKSVAEAAAAAGARDFVQMSAIGADIHSDAHYARSKGQGEAAVRAAFPDAVILRPSIVFGPGDDFFNRFAAMAQTAPALPLIGGGGTLFQPVYVGDVARATLAALSQPEHRGKVYELGGPAVRSFRALLQTMLHYVNRNTPLVSIPFWLASLQGAVFELLPKPLLTRDQVKMLKRDNIVSEGAEGLEALGVTPTPIESVLPSYMDVYRTGGRFTSVRS
ncbi:MAG: complex I NDUFA9 subunit family protein [Alphaproteobacteria bacterium]|nr:complex I NDUFA9 subunit family protein [Alphaproteobacteria bacterium]